MNRRTIVTVLASFCLCALGALAFIATGTWQYQTSYVPEMAQLAHGASPSFARQVVVDGSLRPVGFHQYTDLSSVIDLTDGGSYTIPTTAHVAWLQPESADVRWRDFPRTAGDTTDPTASVGMIIYAGDREWYTGRLDWIELIQVSSGAKLNVTFYAY